MKNLMYTADQPHISTVLIDGKQVDLMLFKGSTYELPENHQVVSGLIAQGHLVPVENTIPNAKKQGGK